MKLAILDRDGVINYDSDLYIKSPAEWRPIPGAIEAIRSAVDNRNHAVATHPQAAEIRGNLSKLSERERQVLDGLVSGLPNKTIAYDLGISPRTVEIHRANVMSKMGAGSLSHLVRMALIADAKN